MMAEFKLGRIRFVWKNEWSTGTTYYKDDVVRFGGRTYICTVGHIASSDFYSDTDVSPTKWNQLTDGQEWKGDWFVNTLYKERDIVRYGGTLYICNDSHTAASTLALGLEQDQSKWDIFLEGIEWKGDWSISVRYKKNDLVKYGGYTYVCNEGHSSASSASLGLEQDQSKWDDFNQGLEYKGTWSGSSVIYKVNDVVKYGASLWIATSQHTSTSIFASDAGNWDQLVEGLEFENEWNVSTIYQPGDIVNYGGNQYLARTNQSGAVPTLAVTDWSLFSRGFNFTSDWNSSTAYRVGDVVRLNGYTYLCIGDNTNQEPPQALLWSRLNSGIFWKGDWQNSTAYKLGDSVRFSNNVYICVQPHTSADDDSTGTVGDNDRSPETDITGAYWNALTIGSETAVMTTKGDLVYYGGAGPTRLPVGREGQVLRAGAEIPEWVTLGEIDHTYFVSEHGADLPAPIYGKTWDKPWKTIRYAAEQVLNGPRNPVAQHLLELNRVFIQKEITAWIRDKVTNNIQPFGSSFDYDEHKCERDVGFVVDRLIYDIGHGGNLKIRSAVQTFFNALDDGPFSNQDDSNGTGPYNNLAVEAPQSSATYSYMLSLVEKILANESPDVVYQNITDDSTAIVTQYFNPDVTVEDTAVLEIRSLVGLITTAFNRYTSTSGSANAKLAAAVATIPERRTPNNLIRVSTGRYRETLPIIVPAYTCIQGDELRSTNAGPAGSLVDISDSYYSINTFNYLGNEIIDHVVLGSAGPSNGVVLQNSAAPFADVEEATNVQQLVQVMKYQADWRLGTMHSAYLSDPTGYDSGFNNARKLVKENKKFLQEEVIAYMIANYPTLKYGKTLTRRDAGYIVDAIVYDLTYGGNALSIAAGLAYWDGDDNTQPQLPASIKTATIAAIGFLKARLQSVAVNATITPLQTTVLQFNGTAGSAGAATAIGNNVDAIISIVTTGPSVVGTTVTLTDPSTSWVDSELTDDYTAISASNFDAIQDSVESYLAANYSDVDYSVSKARRDAAIVLKAVGYDFMFDSNYQTIKAAHAYLRPTASELFQRDDRIKEATRNSLLHARDQAIALMSDSTAIARVQESFYIVDTIIFGGSNEGDICQSEQRNRDYAALQLERNRDYIVSEISAYIANEFSDTVTATTDTVDTITISNTGWLRRNVSIRFTGVSIGGINSDQVYYVQDIVDSTSFKIAETRNSQTALTLTTDTGTMGVELVYNQELCLRDVGTYIDALKYDLKYQGNYKSRYVARYYANAVAGSLEEDMFYLRDGTGLRDMTLEGLSGDLTPPNEYGTSRVTAGAYASLDPGWGPDDFTTWILSRSPYVQGITTLGTGAIGQKIDGALHNGGNDSIVSNDFTQVISDGIGAWVENNGRAELVSVFTYYSHIGYLSTNGGRIRGTNGNNSYGDFGSVAEGFDDREVPNTAVVDNRFQFKATIGNVFTNGSNLLRFEFDNAGIDYTNSTYVLTGGGVGASVISNEFRDNGVYQVRLIETAPSGAGQFGGEGYLTNSNTAQAGSSSSITLANTDGESSTAYIGMKVIITGGTAAGQFGIIDTYNSGTKVATVVRESSGAAGWDHMNPGTAILSPDSSSTYIVEPTLQFAPPTFESQATALDTSSTWNDVIYGETSATYNGVTGTYSGDGVGATFNVIRNGWKYTPIIQTAGTGYNRLETITILGTDLGGTTPENDLIITITSTNSVTGAIVLFDHDGYGSGGSFVAVKSGTNAASYSFDGISWTPTGNLPASGTWSSIAHGVVQDGSSVNDVSRFVTVRSGSAQSAWSEDGITWTAGTLPANAAWSSVKFGNGRFVAIASDDTTVAVSLDGEIWDLTGTLPNTGYVDLAFGPGVWVAIRATSDEAATSADGEGNWAARSLPASREWTSISWGDGKFVAVASDSNSGAISTTGITWASTTIGSLDGSTVAGYQRVRYGQGLFIATAYLSGSTGYSSVATTEDGLTWTAKGIVDGGLGIDGYRAVAFGNPNRQGRWIALTYSTSGHATVIQAGATAKGRVLVADGKIFQIRITEPGSGYTSVPTMTIVDPNNTFEAPFTVRVGSGVLSNPTFVNRGTQFVTGSAEVDLGDGYADNYQPGSFVAARRITQRPTAGSNIVFGHLPNRTFKVVAIVTFLGTDDGSYTAFFQVSPALSIAEAPEHLETLETRIRYSQVRLTGHDFLDIGTGGFEDTNYPGAPANAPIAANETVESKGGRVFFTATDQDGNFRVGDLFSIEQSTGVATLNADAFNISGLQELNLGNVTLGGGSATVTEFSTDPFFTADSDNIVPTQRAIKAYIAQQIGGGGAALNVNKITAGNIEISTNQITNVTGESIKMKATFEFRGGVTGLPIAFNYFLA
jgi:hypothetical protein